MKPQTPAELEELTRLLRERVDPEIALHGGAAFARFIDELHHIDSGEGLPEPPGLRRWQDAVILELIEERARVLDLGCGSGELLELLHARRHTRGQGVELDPERVGACIARGVPVFQADLDRGLAVFAADSFDYVVLEETLQTLSRPAAVLAEMLRVAPRGIVSFPNFGHWRIRLYLMARGRMPISRRLPHHWHDTPNIHNLTYRDFRLWCEEHDYVIDRSHVLCDGEVRPYREGDNLDASEILCVVRRPSSS